MSDFLLELRCEEIPARMQAGARASLDKLFREQMAAAGVSHGELTIWSTPRRLTLIACDLPDATAAVSEELKGPRVGAPPQALDGFLRKTGLTAEQLTERDGILYAISERPGRATRDVLAEAIPAIIRAFPWPKSMRWGEASLSTESLRWVRPLSGIVAILGEELVECEVGGVASGYATLGHRFHHDGIITIGGADDYQEKLRACHVIVDHEERQGTVREMAAAAAIAAGLSVVPDEGLVIENAGLTEWPVPLLGRFDEAFLEVPPEVIQLTARVNQKYFVCQDGEGKFANAFVCTANVEAADGGAAIVDGNRKVLAARLSDARFFWEQDRKKTLAEHAEKLSNIVFHEKLGTVADKVERVAKLARWLVEEGIIKPSPPRGEGLGEGARNAITSPSQPLSPTLSPDGERELLAAQAEQAARLCKADLVTEMVGEFPELQGLMGGYYARAEGLPNTVADAIRDHYKPVGQGDDVPAAPVTVAVSLADKLDTLVGFFFWDERPSGSRDPFALRRAAISIITLVFASNLRLRLVPAIMESGAPIIAARMVQLDRLLRDRILDAQKVDQPDFRWIEELKNWRLRLKDSAEFAELALGAFQSFVAPVLAFLADRLKVQQREAGVRHDLIDAVFALGGEDDLVRLLARVHALQTFVGAPDGTNLLAGYKRAANILKKEGIAPTFAHLERSREMLGDGSDNVSTSLDMSGDVPSTENKLSYTPEPAEAALIAALDSAEPQAESAIAAEDFGAAMAALASLRGPIDAFFDNVTVNDPEPDKRAARLALLARFRAAVHKVADFSKIEG